MTQINFVPLQKVKINYTNTYEVFEIRVLKLSRFIQIKSEVNTLITMAEDLLRTMDKPSWKLAHI